MDYITHMIARMKHEERNNSLISPHEDRFYRDQVKGEKQRLCVQRVRLALFTVINMIVKSS